MKLETERLELKALNSHELRLWTEDMPALEWEIKAAYKAEPMEGEFLRVVKHQLEKTTNDLENYIWHSFFLFVRKSDRVVVGSADFKNLPDKEGQVEIGYGLGKEFEHNGYMTEAVKAMCDWGLKQDGVKTVIAETEVNNLPSQNVLKRCGFEEYKTEGNIWWRLESK
jgi:RimJ/RimL family protein N-acetyltransferase